MTSRAPASIRPARRDDHDAVAALLAANDLPVDGVPRDLHAFVVAESGGRIVGAIGLELYGADALLRSAVVDQSVRGTGLGAQLVAGIIAEAGRRGVSSIWLLTTTAERWFPRFGFAGTTRDAVPEAVKASREFQGACPASAHVMRREG
ncbi:MAG: arsenic resistance N-acetyltransferase ArsN2 [Gemmatimonadaceae bacterium]